MSDPIKEDQDDTTGLVPEIHAEEIIPGDNSSRKFKLTVEPALLLLTFAIALTGPVLQNLVVDRVCEHELGYNKTVCDDLPDYPEIEARAQPRAAAIFMSKQLLEAILPAMLSFFVGPWSDVHGRLPLILVPMAGHALLYLGLLVWSLPFANSWPLYTMLAFSAPVALSGGFVAFVTGAFCLVTDTSSPEERAWRMGVVEAALLIGLPLGLASSSYILAWGGYQVVFSVSAGATLLGFLYVWFVVDETVTSRPEMTTNRSILTSILDTRLISDMVRTCCRPRPGFRRAAMFLVMLVLASTIFTLDGEISVAFLYTREKFGWQLREYTLFSSATVVIATLGTLAGLKVLSSWLRLPDAPLAAFACLTKAVSVTVMGLAPKPWVLYVGSVLGLLAGIASPLGRTILSKSVAREDIGKVFSLASSLDALTPIAAAPLYTLVYDMTLSTMPGTFYLLSAGIFVSDVILLCIVCVIDYKFPASSYVLLSQETPSLN